MARSLVLAWLQPGAVRCRSSVTSLTARAANQGPRCDLASLCLLWSDFVYFHSTAALCGDSARLQQVLGPCKAAREVSTSTGCRRCRGSFTRDLKVHGLKMPLAGHLHVKDKHNDVTAVSPTPTLCEWLQSKSVSRFNILKSDCLSHVFKC